MSSLDNLSYKIRVIICQNDNEVSKYTDVSNNKRRDQRVFLFNGKLIIDRNTSTDSNQAKIKEKNKTKCYCFLFVSIVEVGKID